MKVALDVSPLESGHRFRGIGFYTQSLVDSLQSIKVKDFQLDLVKDKTIPEDCDLVHYPYFDLFYPTLPLIKKKKTVVTIHDVIPLVFSKQYPPGLKGSLGFQIQKFSLKNVSAVITDSRNSKKDIIKYLGFPQEKILVVYLAPVNQFKKLKNGNEKLKVKQKYQLPEKFVLYVGDVNFHKNVLGLAKACQLVKIPLVIVGKQAAGKDFDQTHSENQPLVQLIKQFGDDPRVLRLGFVSNQDLAAIYSLATVYCQPSFYEGFGLPVLEAMAFGTPVVAANVASLPEICGQAALMVDPYQPKKIALGINRILNEPKLCDRLKKDGLKQVKKFSWQKTAHETLEVYQKVAKS